MSKAARITLSGRNYNINISDEDNKNNSLNNVFVAPEILLDEHDM